jgi:hypothetical protein
MAAVPSRPRFRVVTRPNGDLYVVGGRLQQPARSLEEAHDVVGSASLCPASR